MIKKDYKKSIYNNTSDHINLFLNKIPKQFADANIMCLRCGKGTKEPADAKVTYHSCRSAYITEYVSQGGNVGATSLSGFAVFIDGDSEEVRNALESRWDTVSWNTGKPGHKNYLFFVDMPFDGSIPFKDKFDGYVKTRKGYSIIPPSRHPNGRQYGEEFNDVPVAVVKKADLINALKPYFKREVGKPKTKMPDYRFSNTGSLRLKDIIDLTEFKQSGQKFQGSHPIHGSTTGVNFVVDVDRNTWHCFRCDSGGGPLQWIAVAERIIDCSQSIPGAIRGETFWKVIAMAHDKYGLSFEKAAEMLGGKA